MPDKYTAYTTNDFIADEAFQQWVRFPDAASTAFWMNWLLLHPHKKAAVDEAVHFLQSLRFHEDYPSQQQVAASLQKNLERIAAQEAAKNRRGSKKIWIACLAAAAVLAAVVATNFFHKQQPLTIEVATAGGELRTMLLPDSSTVTLNGKSRLRYVSDMSQRREVWLDGEGFFNVQHKAGPNKTRRNFIVHSGGLDIEVLGTTFNVKKENGATNVSLNTGSIRIGLKDRSGTLLSMAPGDFIQYRPAEKKITRKLVRPELYSVWKEEKLALDAVSAADLAQMIRDTYGYEVVFDDPGMANEKISGSLYLNNEVNILDAVAFTLGVSYARKDSVVHFQSKRKNN
jgi:transmembrane sensor